MDKDESGYLAMLRHILDNGVYEKDDGDDYGRKQIFCHMLRYDLSDRRLPLITSKQTWFKGIAYEMLWFLSGSQRLDFLHDNNVHFWDVWGNEKNYVGPMYGYQWRHWPVDPDVNRIKVCMPCSHRTRRACSVVKQDLQDVGRCPEGRWRQEVDQIAVLMDGLKNRPEARSHVVEAWRPDHIPLQSIKICHDRLQFYYEKSRNELSCSLTQRSCDAFLGVPFNIAQYALLLHMVAHQLGCKAKEFIWIGQDVHVYDNHFDQVEKQLGAEVREFPKLSFTRQPQSIFDYTYADFELIGYVGGERIPGGVSAQGKPGKGLPLPFDRYYAEYGESTDA
jgi:thymidylate synthase